MAPDPLAPSRPTLRGSGPAGSGPPLGCSRPGVPGTANWRARVSGSRAYGWNGSPVLAKTCLIGLNELTSGMRHGSEPLGIAPSDSRITGVWYDTAIRTASRAVSKQSEGERGASTATGDSPLRPNNACSRSACSVLVGSPVDGPPRWTSMTINGSSVITASPKASDFSEMPGPDVLVTPSAPP